jgi:preprotein translocase subunit SecB
MSDTEPSKKQFNIQKIYLKDASFESPGSPASFGQKSWDPHLDLNMNNTHAKIADDQYEAVLTITLTASHDGNPTFLIEIQQAGIFSISGFNEEETKYLLGSQCASTLFPYAREQISELSVRGGFPPLLLAPVNFDALYHQHLQKRQEKAAVGEADDAAS